MRIHRPVIVSLVGALVASVLTGIVAAPPAAAVNQISKMSGFNARAWTVTQPDANGIRYIGGDFTSFQAWQTGKAARVSASTGEVDPTFPSFGSQTNAVVADGLGGFILASGSSIKRILADGSTDSTFAPTVNGAVNSMAMHGSTVIIAGNFTTVNGQGRARAAAINLDGTLQSWNPSVSHNVLRVRVFGNTAYIVGQFNQIGTLSRAKVGAVRLDARSNSTGTCVDNYDEADCVTVLAPTVGGWGVKDIAVSGSTVYVAGAISVTPAGGSTISNFAAMSTSTAADNAGVSTWDPAPNSEVITLAIAGGTLYAGGYFDEIAGVGRGMGAAFDISTTPLSPTITAWNPQAVRGGNYNNAADISDIEIVGTTAYLGGSFWSLGTAARNRIGAVDLSTGAATSWDPHVCDWGNGVSSHVYDIAVSGSEAVFGGDFDCVGGLQRKHAAAVGPDGIITSWAPAVSGSVTAFSSDGSTVYMVGQFSQVIGSGSTPVNGNDRRWAAAVTTSGALTTWKPEPNGDRPVDVLVNGSSVYLAGFFGTVDGTSRTGLAKVDATTGTIDAGFDADLNGAAEHLALSGGRLYAAGRFSTSHGSARPIFVAVDAATGALDAWNVGTPLVTNPTTPSENHGRGLYGTAIAVMGDLVYLGGSFLSIQPDGQQTAVVQRYAAAVDKTTGALDLTWRPATVRGHNGNGDAYVITPTATAIYIGGQHFTVTENGQTRSNLVAVDSATGALITSFSADTGEVRGLSASNAAVFVAGSFGSIGSASRQNTGAVSRGGAVLDPWPMNPATSRPVAITTSNQGGGQSPAAGAVTSSPPGIACETGSDSCAYGFETGQTVTLTAVPEAGATFDQWDGDCTGSSPTCIVTITTTTNVTARFSTGGAGGSSGSPSGQQGSTTTAGGTTTTAQGAGSGSHTHAVPAVAPSEDGATAARATMHLHKGKRVVAGPVDRVRVRIQTSGLPAGTVLRPMVRPSGKTPFKPGRARVVVKPDGSATWSRRVPKGKAVAVYFTTTTADGSPASSTRVRWLPRR